MIKTLALLAVLAPLTGSLIAGLFRKQVGVKGATIATISGVGIALLCALVLADQLLFQGVPSYNHNLYTWVASGEQLFHVGFLIDNLTVIMMVVVTFVSLLVHIYSIGYMKGDPGYQRFFCYMSLFTFAMLMLVMANNLLQTFFGWEGVGVVSYLLIGFWFKKDSAANGSFKAFLVNRVGDLGFVIGLAACVYFFGTLDYQKIFSTLNMVQGQTVSVIPGTQWQAITFIAVFIFIGCMAKSAQLPLHIWLPESMEGPTPISALIHAATMVTAGIFLVARMSPLYEMARPAMSLIMIFGATGGLFLGMLAVVENDIKRVIAYSTMSQLGYMMAANGASAFSAGIFHLMTHACFKALLFLAAGSVIIAMHHEQDMRKMGGLRKYMPITYITFLIGSLALCAVPPFAGFYSKEAVIEAVHLSTIPGAEYAYVCLAVGSFVTALYTFRAFFMTFHGEERFDEHTREHVKESPRVVTWPLILLAIPSVFLGGLLAYQFLYADPTLLGKAIYVAPQYDVLKIMAEEYHGAFAAIGHAFVTLPFWMAISGIVLAWFAYMFLPSLPAVFFKRFRFVAKVLEWNYGFDHFNKVFIVKPYKVAAGFFYRFADAKIIDHSLVNGSGRGIVRLSNISRKLQSGYLYHYVFVMIIGLLAFMLWLLL